MQRYEIFLPLPRVCVPFLIIKKSFRVKGKPFFWFLVLFFGSADDAEDVAQEMLLQLKQVILVEKIELDAATMALNKKYEAYLEKCKSSIEI